MHKLNILFTLSSLSVILVTIERFSFTTKVLLQPYNFLRLHEAFQMTTLILITVLIPFFILYYSSEMLALFVKKKFVWILVLFIGGVYFYSTGNGLHEMASFTLNQYCNVKSVTGTFCNGQFFNDYYTGNILYFIGGIFMVLALLLTEKINPNLTYTKKDVSITVINAVIYAFAIFAYAAFDPVLVGLVYSLIITVVAVGLWLGIRKKYLQYPVIFYTALTYTIGTVAAIFVRFH
jgi:hypothetical protein